MASWEDVARIVEALPMVETDGHAWSVQGKGFAWERPLRKADLAALGAAAPAGPILAARVPDVGAKDALIADRPDIYFTTPHFNGYPAILAQLAHIDDAELQELLVEAWLARAPRKVAEHYLADHRPR